MGWPQNGLFWTWPLCEEWRGGGGHCDFTLPSAHAYTALSSISLSNGGVPVVGDREEREASSNLLPQTGFAMGWYDGVADGSSKRRKQGPKYLVTASMNYPLPHAVFS